MRKNREPEEPGWYVDSEEECWQKTEDGWALLDAYAGSHGMTSPTPWSEVKLYGPMIPATPERVRQEQELSEKFQFFRVLQEGNQV